MIYMKEWRNTGTVDVYYSYYVLMQNTVNWDLLGITSRIPHPSPHRTLAASEA
jgi:hypothetical protein